MLTKGLLVVVAVLTTTSSVGAQGALPDVDQFGPQVGEVVPAFSLPDQNGETRDLASVMGPNGVMLVFSRSADW